MQKEKIKVGIVGATGYAGGELLRLLTMHPFVSLHCVVARSEVGRAVVELYPSLRGFVDHLTFQSQDSETLEQCDVVFFATPHGVAMSQAKRLLQANVKIIDLAADFRLKSTELFQQWYKMEHACPEILKEAVYGQPETMREQMRNARVFGMAGCYPTSVQVGLLPLMEYEKQHPGTFLIEQMIADCKSGISGAGKKADVSLLCSEMADNFHAYALKGHRHQPEIEQQLRYLCGNESVHLNFIPHLLPTIRGIH